MFTVICCVSLCVGNPNFSDLGGDELQRILSFLSHSRRSGYFRLVDRKCNAVYKNGNEEKDAETNRLKSLLMETASTRISNVSLIKRIGKMHRELCLHEPYSRGWPEWVRAWYQEMDNETKHECFPVISELHRMDSDSWSSLSELDGVSKELILTSRVIAMDLLFDGADSYPSNEAEKQCVRL